MSIGTKHSQSEVVDAHHELLKALGLEDTINVSPAEAMLWGAEEIVRLKEALKPFHEAWQIACRNGTAERLTLGEFGAIAAHHVAAVHYRWASTAFRGEAKPWLK